MNDTIQLAIFRAGDQRLGLAMSMVLRIVRAVEVTPLPNAPAIVLGMIDVAGEILPVLDLRQRLGLPAQEITPDQQFLIARTSQRTVVLAMDEALGVVTIPAAEPAGAAAIVRGLEHIQGVARLAEGLFLIQDLEKFLSPVEGRGLDAALRQEGGT